MHKKISVLLLSLVLYANLSAMQSDKFHKEAKKLLKKATTYINAGKQKKGIQLLKNIIASDCYKGTEAYIGAQYKLARRRLYSRNYRERTWAISTLQEIIKQDISIYFKANAYLDIALQLKSVNNYSEALNCLQKILELDRSKASKQDVWMEAELHRTKIIAIRSKIALTCKDINIKGLEAIASQNKYKTLKADALIQLGLFYINAKERNHKKSVESFMEFLTLSDKYPQNPFIQEHIAMVYFQLGYIYNFDGYGIEKNTKKAINYYRQASRCKGKSDNPLAANYYLGTTYEQMGETKQAIRYLHKALDFPDNIIKADTTGIERIKKQATLLLSKIYSDQPRKEQYKFFEKIQNNDKEINPKDLVKHNLSKLYYKVPQEVKEELLQKYQDEKDSLTKIISRFTCASCHQTGLKLKKCSRCRNISYCSRKCQVKDWPKHKEICRNS